MVLRIIGNVARAKNSRKVEDLMRERGKNGAQYLDLRTGDLLMETVNEKHTPPEPEPNTPKKYTKEELEGMKMKELREIGKPLGAIDTKKAELIDEILEFQ